MRTLSEDDFTPSEWDRYAECYDALLTLLPYQELVAKVEQALAPQEGERILDAGCGTGTLLSTLADSGALLSGIDFSDSMLRYAARKCPGTVALGKADLNDTLPLKDNTFSKLVCVNTLYALRDPGASLREFHRVLMPGGRLVLQTPKRGYDNGLVLKAHARSLKPDDYWSNPHTSPEREEALIREALRDEELIERMRYVALHNRRIAQTATFHFFDMSEILCLVRDTGFAYSTLQGAYAGQGFLVTATAMKGGSHEDH